MQRAPCALALSFFLPARLYFSSIPHHFHPYFATTDLYFYRRPVGRYVACAHHAPTVSIPPIGRLATGHFGPCGGCASIPRLCLPPHIGDLRCVGGTEVGRLRVSVPGKLETGAPSGGAVKRTRRIGRMRSVSISRNFSRILAG